MMISQMLKYGLMGGAALIFGFAAFDSFYTVDKTERVIHQRNGAVVGCRDAAQLDCEVAEGWHFKVPLIDGISRWTLTEQLKSWGNEEGLNFEAYSFDLQPADLHVSVNYKLDPTKIIQAFNEYRYFNQVFPRLIEPRIPKIVKNVFGSYNASRAIQERTQLNLDCITALQTAFAGTPVQITDCQIQDIKFSQAYEKSIEERMLAEVEVQRIRQNAEREKVNAQIKIIQANAEAEAVRARAQAEADAKRMQGDAEAQAIKAKGDALAQNPGLVDLIKAERWTGQLPVTMLPNSTLPFIEMNPKEPLSQP